MDLKDITECSLFLDSQIRKAFVNGQWLFSQIDLSNIYGEIFWFMEGELLSDFPKGTKSHYIPIYEIKEQIEHWLNRPSFDEIIRKTLNIIPKK